MSEVDTTTTDVETKPASNVQENDEQFDETTEESGTSEELDQNDDTENDVDSDDQDDESKEQHKQKKKGGFKKRIERFQRRLSESELEIIKRDQRIAYLESLQGNQNHTTQQSNIDKPDINDPKFETLQDYYEALAEWKFEQKTKAIEENKKKQEEQKTHQEKISSFQKEVKELQKTKPDYQEVLNDVGHINLTKNLIDSLLSSEHRAEILYDMAQDPDELERINSLSSREIDRIIGKYEARVESRLSQKKDIKKLTTNAPSPISTVKGGSSNFNKSLNDPSITFAEYEKIRTQQLKNKK